LENIYLISEMATSATISHAHTPTATPIFPHPLWAETTDGRRGRKSALKLRFMAIEMRRMKSGSGCRGLVDC